MQQPPTQEPPIQGMPIQESSGGLGFGLGSPPPSPAMGGTGAEINLNTVSFEQLRAEGLSVTQATRLLAHRERIGSFRTVEELDQVPGFPQDFLQVLKSRSTI